MSASAVIFEGDDVPCENVQRYVLEGMVFAPVISDHNP